MGGKEAISAGLGDLTGEEGGGGGGEGDLDLLLPAGVKLLSSRGRGG